MTSQRDETVGHRAGDEIEDDPIVVERHDEILGGPPAEDRAADDAPARDELASDQMASDQLATDQMASDGPARDELAGRPAAPGTGSTGLDQDPPPLVVPAGPASADDPAAPGWASTSGAQAAAPEPGVPVTPGSAPAAASTAAASTTEAAPVPASPADAGSPAASVGEPAAGPNGNGVPAAALAGQQWPAIQAMFVDDPKGSVERAAAAADEVVKAFVASLQREQTALRAAWEKDTSTEDLRTALQQYRAFCGRLEGLA
jgi:hypothetical protein